MINYKRYKNSDVSAARFYQMPKFLFEGELTNLSNDARVLYSLLKDRHELSLQNRWINDDGEVYLIFTRENMCSLLGCSQPTVRKAFNQLKEANLVDEERQGMGRPNLIYLYYAEQELSDHLIQDDKELEENTEKTPQPGLQQGVKESFIHDCKNLSLMNEKIFQSRVKKSFSHDCKNFSPNDTNINKTNYSDTDNQSHSHSLSQTATLDRTNDSDLDIQKNNEHEAYERLIKENIGFYDLIQARYLNGVNIYREEDVQEIVNCMLDVICTKGETVKISGEDKNRELVKSVYLKLRQSDIEHVINQYRNQHHEIKQVHKYIKAMLYSVSQECSHHYINAVRADGLVRRE
jgi:DNA-binding transcriptional regulator YhcF (GntR family)